MWPVLQKPQLNPPLKQYMSQIMSKRAADFMKKATKIFITLFHKSELENKFLCEFSYVFNALPCTPVLTLSPPCSLYIIFWYLTLNVWIKDSTCILSTDYTGHIEMDYPNCVQNRILASLWPWGVGVPSLVMYSFHFVATFNIMDYP